MNDTDQIAAEAAERIATQLGIEHDRWRDVTAIIEAAIEKAYKEGYQDGHEFARQYAEH